MIIELTINGQKVRAEVTAETRLIDLLRDTFHLTSVKEGCGVGECGACTVLLNNDPVCSCLTSAVQARGTDILTVEGLERNGELDVIQTAFLEHEATQCGFCTPGMILTAKALLLKNPRPNRAEIKKALAGNLCRCTGFVPIIDAVLAAARIGVASAAKQGKEARP